MAYPNGMMTVPNPKGQSMFTNDIFSVPANLSAMDMMNSELMQKALNPGISESEIPTLPYPQVQADKPR
jgi:hypothetical protein